MKKIILTIGIGLAVLFILAIFIYPEPNKEYTGFWYSLFTGAIHGACLIPNWIISFFNPNHLIKATSYSANYNFFWWLGLFIYNLYFLFYRIVVIIVLWIIEKKYEK